jgi:hypothetical protein
LLAIDELGTVFNVRPALPMDEVKKKRLQVF